MVGSIARLQPYRQNPYVVSVGDTYSYIYGEKLDSNEFLYIQVCSVECDAAPTGEIRWFIDGHGKPHFIAEQATVLINRLYFLTEDMYVGPGERLGIRVNGLASTKIMNSYISGLKIVTFGDDIDMAQVQLTMMGARIIPALP